MSEKNNDSKILTDEEIYYIPSFNHPNRINLNVPYSDKDYVKDNGAHWDPILKKWYIIKTDTLIKRFSKYVPKRRLLYKRVPTDHLNEVMPPHQVFNLQTNMELSNSEYAELLCITEDQLVKIKKGALEMPKHASRILLFQRRSAYYDAPLTPYSPFLTLEDKND